MQVVEPIEFEDDGTSGFPRVLVATSQAFNHVTGGGVTISNLFRGWPKDRLATVHNDVVPVKDDVCSTFFRIGPPEIKKWGPLGYAERILRPNPATLNISAEPGDRPDAPPTAGAGALGAVRRSLFGEDGLPETARISSRLESWIEAFEPEILYTTLGNNALMQLIDMIRVRWNLPLVVHAMDDWRTHIYAKGLLSAPRQRFMRDIYRKLVVNARLRLGICQFMCDAYEREFKLPFLAFQNTIDISKWAEFSKTDVSAGAEFKIVYAGSILPFAQLQGLKDVCAAVAGLRKGGRAVRLDIFSPAFMATPFRCELEIDDGISLNDPIPDRDTYFKRLCEADLLVLPVNFDARSIRFIRCSMPSKIPECLLTGVPILVYGPKETAQVDYALRDGWGFVVTKRGVSGLTEAIGKLADDTDLRQRLAAKARKLAVEKHDSRIVRDGFQAELRRAATL